MRILILLFTISNLVLFSQNKMIIKEKTLINLQTNNILPYLKDFSGVYSVEVFKKINDTTYCFLSKAKKTIIFFDTKYRKKIKEIKLNFLPIDILLLKNRIYVAGMYHLYELDCEGKILSKKYIFDKIKYVSKINEYNNIIYIIDNQQNSWHLDSTNKLIKTIGVVLNNNLFGKIYKTTNHQFTLTIFEKGKESISKIFNTEQNLGTIKLLGASKNNIFIEKQIITQEIPLKVIRFLEIYNINNKNINFVNKIQLPDLYYTYIKRDIEIINDNIDFLISSPSTSYIFEIAINKINEKSNIKFPKALYNIKYHYNNNLEPVNELINPENTLRSMQDAITRQEIINNAEPYSVYEWYCNSENIKDYDCGGEHVKTPLWVQVGTNISIPYMWGGFSSLPQFDQGLNNDVSAGDTYTIGNSAGSACAVGVDCSGFVSRCWNLPYKYGTSTLPNISTQYSSFNELKRADIVNYAGAHVRLIHSVNSDGSFLIIEAAGTATNWRVGYNNYTTADLQDNYIPRYYNDIVEDTLDTVPPTTVITANNWENNNFQVTFTDEDNEQINQKFYQVSYFNGTEWLGNNNNGFLHDNFSGSSINSQWIQNTGSWTNLNETLNQTDETNTNTNIYTNLNQTNGYTYLYKWKMKIDGTKTNRRAGLYFMCDNPTATQRNNAYMIYFRVDQNTCQIYKSENNTIDLKTNDFCIVNQNEWFDAMVTFNTNTGKIDIYKDGKLISSWVDSNPHTAGNYISLRTGEANVSYDNFAVYKSRNNIVSVSIGANGDAKYENPNPNIPACNIKSLVNDMARNFSNTVSYYVNIDTTAPFMTIVNDGLSYDVDSTNYSSGISANWSAANEPNSNILNYLYCIGTSEFYNNIADWTNNGQNLSFTKDIQLNSGTTYFVSVKAINSAGLESNIICTDGITIDTTLIINTKTKQKFKLYPIPANNVIYFETQQKINKIEIIDINGKIRTNVDTEFISPYMIKINIQNLPNAVYFVRINKRYFRFIKI